MKFENLRIWEFGNRATRKILRILFLCILLSILNSQFSIAQHYVGLKGGYGAAMGRFYPKFESSMIWNKYTGGMMWKYYSDQQVVGGVSAELEYHTRGYRIYEYGDIVSDTTNYVAHTRTVSSITVPLIWQPHIYLAKQRIRLFINAGFTFTYNLGIGDTETTTEYVFNETTRIQTSTSTTVPYVMGVSKDVRWNYGICGGLGLGVLFGRFEVFAEARYYFGMSDILRNKTTYTFADVNGQGSIRSELDNLFINVGVFFRLGKGGITERPLGKRKAPPPRDNDFRNIKLDNMGY